MLNLLKFVVNNYNYSIYGTKYSRMDQVKFEEESL